MTEKSESTSSYREQIDLLAEEFADRLRHGESPTIDEYVERFPDLADQIRDIFPALMMMDRALPDPDRTRTPTRRFEQMSRVGDYRIIRHVGQGGMGVVYEAQQESLGRRVALKVLPEHISRDEKFIERFRREARAAANLHHTNIVPVYEVGQDGETFYYAMQFIEGQPLDEVQKEIARIQDDKSEASGSTVSRLLGGSDSSSGSSGSSQKRMGYYKSIARLGASISDALAYAHERSIIHRDVKPSNLILDTEGGIWLADFGLAKTDDSELTETGDFLGTARYMSPERFQGKGDHRGDIYGLGVTLYELITLKRAFGAEDRLHLIEQIANQDPKRPRETDRHIPLDLETIILKAMEKEPRRRYQNAAELADDLRRFLDDQPIRARRATIVERASRWVRRNKAQAAAMVSMAAAIAILIVSSFLILEQKEIAQANLVESERQKTRADAAAGDAKREAKSARNAVKRMLTAVGDERLRNIPQMDGLRKQLLEDALEFNQQFVSESDDIEDQREAAHAYLRIARIYTMLENNTEVESAFDRSRDLFEKVAAAIPDDRDSQRMLAAIDTELANHYIKLARHDDALPLAKSCLNGYGKLSAFQENDPILMAGKAYGHQLLARIYRQTGKLEKAENHFRSALAVYDEVESLGEVDPNHAYDAARTRLALGQMLTTNRRPDQAKENYDRAFRTIEKLVESQPNERIFREALADCCNLIGALQIQRGQLPDARESFSKAVDVLMKLAKEFPQIPNYKSDAAVCLNGLAVAYAIGGQSDAAEKEFRRAVEISDELVENFAEVEQFRYENAHSTRRLAVHFLNTNRPQLAVEPFAKAYQRMKDLADSNPKVTKYRKDLAELAFLVSTTIQKTDRTNVKGVEWAELAVEIAERLATDLPSETNIRHKLAKYYRLVSQYKLDKNDHQETARLLQKAIDIQRKIVQEVPGFEEPRRHLAISLHEFSVLELERENFDQAERYSREALGVRQKNIEANPGRYDHSLEMLISRYQLGKIYFARKDFESAVEQYQLAIDYCKKKIDEVPEHSRFRYQYLVSIKEMIESLVAQKETEKAKRYFDVAEKFRKAEAELDEKKRNPDVLDIARQIQEFWQQSVDDQQ